MTVLMILKWILAFIFLMAGSMKLIQPRERVIANAGKWAEDFTDSQVKLIGVAEVVLAFALFLPPFFGRGYYIIPGASFGMAVVMAGAAFTHYRRKEYSFLALNIVLLLLAAFITLLLWPF